MSEMPQEPEYIQTLRSFAKADPDATDPTLYYIDSILAHTESLAAQLREVQTEVARYQEKADAINKYVREEKFEAVRAVVTELVLDSERRAALAKGERKCDTPAAE